jgi:hypothetical protein
VTRPDDSTLSPHQFARVQKEAQRLLHKSDAIGVFPTPVAAIMDAEKVAIETENVFDEGFLASIRRKAGTALRSALSKVIGLYDARARLVFIDRAVHLVRQTFLKLHETAHAVLPWQRDLYAVVEDGEQELDPDVAALFDREANVFATEVLFQLDSFAVEAADQAFGIKVPLGLSKQYGASVYSSIRQYVSKNPRDCLVLVLDPPELKERHGFRACLRRAVSSPTFREKFDFSWPESFTPRDQIGAMVPVGGRRMSRPREIVIVDRNGARHECVAEAFTTTHHVFILILARQTLTKTTIILPAFAH